MRVSSPAAHTVPEMVIAMVCFPTGDTIPEVITVMVSSPVLVLPVWVFVKANLFHILHSVFLCILNVYLN